MLALFMYYKATVKLYQRYIFCLILVLIIIKRDCYLLAA